VKLGIVESLNRPGGNLTGVVFFNSALSAKRLELLRELAPRATVIGFLLTPTIPKPSRNSRMRAKPRARSGWSLEFFPYGTSATSSRRFRLQLRVGSRAS
jgi:ABC-type uncharacterized transport system substrate-binding protein